jgi:hypothetical protein
LLRARHERRQRLAQTREAFTALVQMVQNRTPLLLWQDTTSHAAYAVPHRRRH